MLTLFLASLAAGAECETPTTAADLVADLDHAEEAFGNLEIPAFLEAMDRLSTTTLPCQSEPVEPAVAARVHIVTGLRAFGERDVYAVQAFAAARALQPGYVLPETLVAQVSPIRQDFESMSLAAGRTKTAPEPKKAELLFDGRPTRERPTAWGTVFQLVDRDGVTQTTAYLRPDDPLPQYEVVPRTVVTPVATRRKVFGDAPPALVAGSAGAAVLGVGLYAAAGASHARWSADDAKASDLDALRTRTNALSIGAGVAGLTAAGLGVGVALTW